MYLIYVHILQWWSKFFTRWWGRNLKTMYYKIRILKYEWLCIMMYILVNLFFFLEIYSEIGLLIDGCLKESSNFCLFFAYFLIIPFATCVTYTWKWVYGIFDFFAWIFLIWLTFIFFNLESLICLTNFFHQNFSIFYLQNVNDHFNQIFLPGFIWDKRLNIQYRTLVIKGLTENTRLVN